MASQVGESSNKRKTIDAYFKSTKTKKIKETGGPQPDQKASGKEASGKEANAKDAGNHAEDEPPTHLDPDEYRLELETIAPSWLKHLKAELDKPYFHALKRFLRQEHAAKKTIYPPAGLVYSWTRFAAIDQIKVVILGQDPYHGPGQAHGLAFSVQAGVRVPPSLLNMYKALEGYRGFTRPAHGYLGGWAEQGVLLLNASLTVERARANSHANRGWEQFTDRVVELVNAQEHVVFMLWGAYAQKKGQRVDKTRHLVLKTVHPSPLSAHRGFFECRHFEKANEYLEAHGRQAIDWSRLPAQEKKAEIDG
ncbi:uracil DNA glycosylase [Coemansia sp. RSA 2706]|nr:uracil DNA glycosylase [Coemansia sp. RSA 2708]KAJ2300344.1 uracil DNA glycosylase [Coemansia sp. RSA 2706]